MKYRRKISIVDEQLVADSLEPGPKFIAPWADLQAGVVQAKSFGRSLALAAGVAGAAGLVTLIVTGP